MAPNTLCDTANSDDAKGNLTLVEKILQTGFRIDWHSEWRQSPLFVAVAKVLEPGVFLLLRYSADANGRLDTLRPKPPKAAHRDEPTKIHSEEGPCRRRRGPKAIWCREFDIYPVGEVDPVRGISDFVKKYPASAGKEDKVIRYEE